MARGVMEYARERGPWEFAFSPEASQVSLESLADWDGDGVLTMVELPAQLRLARGLKRPLVNLSAALSLAGTGLPSVVSDNAAIGRAAADHLLGRGFRRFGYYGLEGVWYSDERLDGFRTRVEEAGFPCEVHLTTSSLTAGSPWRWDRAGLAAWLESVGRPVAILAAHDYRARMVLEICHQLGLRVPFDVALVGVNDDPLACEAAFPPLTSVAQNGERIGFEAASLLDRLIDGAAPPSQPIEILPAGLVARASTETLAVEDPILRPAIAEILERLDQPFGIDQIAAHRGVSRRWLEHLFRTHLGCTPHEFITSARVEKARELLISQPELRLGQLARLRGFRDARRLNLAYANKFGRPPRDDRPRPGLPPDRKGNEGVGLTE